MPVQITNSTGTTTYTYPTPSTVSTGYPTLGLVSSATVPNAANSLFQAAGATMCACQYLQWGYWEANISPTNNGGASNTVQSSFINTWVAGTPAVNIPTSGVGNFVGAAIGTVSNNGSNYLAAGSFANTYNFGTNTGTLSINNFDGQNYNGTVSGSSGTYSGSISNGATRNGSVLGQLYGPAAAETGGTFFLHATTGPSYLASGIFAGKR
jgi:trimeric autotransporter adhesin